MYNKSQYFKTRNHSNLFIFFLTSILLIPTVLLTIIQCSVVTKEEQIVKTDDKYIYVKKYKPFNSDSIIVKYDQPYIIEAKLASKYRRKTHKVEMYNVKTKETFSYENEKFYDNVKTNKIYKFKYTSYPKNKQGYELVTK